MSGCKPTITTHDRASLLASIAHIPWLTGHFIGFISGFWLDGRLFRLATHTGARQHLELGADSVSLVFKNPRTELRIRAHHAPGTALVSPISGDMTGKINEPVSHHPHRTARKRPADILAPPARRFGNSGYGGGAAGLSGLYCGDGFVFHRGDAGFLCRGAETQRRRVFFHRRGAFSRERENCSRSGAAPLR
ncbi:MAG: hypothetical protein IPM98_05065 [Lewinellaceae bacterium]|nr:hypothetical protein [Lewinellaceae bacterium]